MGKLNPLDAEDVQSLELIKRLQESHLANDVKLMAIQVVCYTPDVYPKVMDIIDRHRGQTRHDKLFDLTKSVLAEQLDAMNR